MIGSKYTGLLSMRNAPVGSVILLHDSVCAMKMVVFILHTLKSSETTEDNFNI